MRVLERRGFDARPFDPTREEGRLTLLAYVWPDMTARFERLSSALEVARVVVARVELGIDGTYHEATLDPPLSPFAWRRWSCRWDAQPGDQRRTGAITARAEKAFGYKPTVGARAGLTAQIAWHRSLRTG